MKKEKIINYHIYPSFFTNESRIMKETASLINLNIVDEIIMIGVWKEGLETEEIIDPRRKIIRIKEKFRFSKGIFGFFSRYILFQLQVIIYLNRCKISVINCHNLSVLGIGVYLKVFKKIPLIYDAHELETEVDGATGIKKKLGKILEKFYIQFVDQVIVVGSLIKEWYEKEYNIYNVTLIRNVPYNNLTETRQDLLRSIFKIPTSQLVFIYQGLLSKSRGVDLILEVFTNQNVFHHIVFMGMGELSDEIKNKGRIYSNIHFLPAVPATEVYKYTSSADVGIHLIQNTCLNHYYCVPNKIFEYLVYGIPQIISNFPEMIQVIDGDKYGWAINPTKSELLKILTTVSVELVGQKKKEVLKIRNNWGWHIEEKSLQKVYDNLSIEN